MKITRMVVGVDASAAGRAALDWTLREAALARLPLHAVRAYQALPLEPFYVALAADAEGMSLVKKGSQELADDELSRARRRTPGADDVDARAEVVLGTAAPVLSEYSNSETIVVVGSRGNGPLSRIMLGSVASSVLHHAAGPVVVVPQPAEPTSDAPRVVVGVDHSPESFKALQVAVSFAERHAAPLVAVHVHEECTPPPGSDLRMLEACDARSLREALHRAGGAALVADIEVVTGHTAEQLLAQVHPQDLLVLGSRGRGGFAGLVLGSTSSQCTHHARCPVLVTRGA